MLLKEHVSCICSDNFWLTPPPLREFSQPSSFCSKKLAAPMFGCAKMMPAKNWPIRHSSPECLPAPTTLSSFNVTGLRCLPVVPGPGSNVLSENWFNMSPPHNHTCQAASQVGPCCPFFWLSWSGRQISWSGSS